MVNDLPGCLWLRLWVSGYELQGRRRMPGQATITQHLNTLFYYLPGCSDRLFYYLPGCSWLGLSGGQGRRQLPSNKVDWYLYSMSCLDIPHFAPEDAGKSSKGARGSKGYQRRQPLASNKINGLWLVGYFCLASEEAGKSSRGGWGFQAGDGYPTMSRLFYYILAYLFLAWTWTLRERKGRAPGAAEYKAGDNFSTQQQDRLIPYTIWVTRISLILPLRMHARAPRAPGAAEVAKGGDH